MRRCSYLGLKSYSSDCLKISILSFGVGRRFCEIRSIVDLRDSRLVSKLKSFSFPSGLNLEPQNENASGGCPAAQCAPSRASMASATVFGGQEGKRSNR